MMMITKPISVLTSKTYHRRFKTSGNTIVGLCQWRKTAFEHVL